MKTYLPYILIFLGLFAASAWYFTPTEVFIQTKCDLTKESCILEQDGVKLVFTTGEKEIKQKAPVDYTLHVEGLNNPVAKIFLYGQSMTMTTEIIDMTPVGQGDFVAKRNFPICTEKEMTWRAHLSIKGDKKIVKTNFVFDISQDQNEK